MCTNCFSICDKINLLDKQIKSTEQLIDSTIKSIEQISKNDDIDSDTKKLLTQTLASFIQSLTTELLTMIAIYYTYVRDAEMCKNCDGCGFKEVNYIDYNNSKQPYQRKPCKKN
jgi:hypothetical protein